MGSFLICCRQREQLIDFNELESLDPELKDQIGQIRKEHEKQMNACKEYKNGDAIFRGIVDHNKRKVGYGQLYKRDLVYFGNFEDDKPHGYGVIIKADQEYYRGQFANGKYHGMGRQFSHLHEFQGEYQNGSRKKGILRTNVFQYQGEFHDNMFQGHGNLRLLDGGNYDGMFKKGKYHGKGFLTFLNGNKYQGNFTQGKYDGDGKFIWKDGIAAVGSYEMGVRKHRTLTQNRLLSKPHLVGMSKVDIGQLQSTRPLKWFDYTEIPKVKSGNGMLYLY